MKVEIFDDWKSIFHFILGFINAFVVGFFLLFLLYEVLEHLYKRHRKEETIEQFYGDLIEFIIGYACGESMLDILNALSQCR